MNLTIGDTEIILSVCRKYGATDTQTAYILATAYHETRATMKPVKEAYWVSNAEAWRSRNLRYYPWYGRGYVQLTWEANYVKAGKALNRDLTTDPDVVMDPQISAEILVMGMLEGWFTGKFLESYIWEDHKDYVGARRIVNGTDKADLIASYAVIYEGLLKTYKTPVAPVAVPAQNPLQAIIAFIVAILAAITTLKRK
jgi:putative chitinase